MVNVVYVFYFVVVSKVKLMLDVFKYDIVYVCVEVNVKGTENVFRVIRERDDEFFAVKK